MPPPVASNLTTASHVALGALGAARVFEPPDELREVVGCLFAAHWHGGGQRCWWFPPDLRSHLAIVSDADRAALWLLPPRTRSLVVQPAGPCQAVGLVCNPGFAQALLERLPVRRSRQVGPGFAIDLVGGLPPEWRGNDWTRVLSALQQDLSRDSQAVGSFTRRLGRALLRTTVACVGRVPLLADQLALHQRTLGRQLQRRLAVGGKQALQVARLQRTLVAAAGSRRPDWISLALDHGYYDQAHFCEAMRDLVGLNPRRAWRLLTGHSDHPLLLERLGCLPLVRPPDPALPRHRDWRVSPAD